MSSSLRLLLALVVLLNIGCASYQNSLSKPLDDLRRGEAKLAAASLKEPAFKDSKDQLAYLLDYSITQHIAEDYQASNEGFLLAYDLSDWKDYHSISKIGASLLLNQGMVQYKGEEYEKLLISVYAAMNFLLLDDPESARVEVRRIHERIQNLEYEGEKVFQNMPFAYYLSALIWEKNGNLDSAYIDYKNTYKYAPDFKAVQKDLLRLSKRLGRAQEHKKFKEEFESIEMPKADKNKGQLVVIYQQGFGPKKRPHPNWHRIPKVYASSNEGVRAKIKIQDKEVKTATALDLNQLAMESMEKQYASLIAKRAAGIATKAVVAKQIQKENQALGDIAWIAMNLADQADLRQWLLLPSSIQVAKFVLPSGDYEIKIQALNSAGLPTGEEQLLNKTVSKGGVHFVNWRSFR